MEIEIGIDKKSFKAVTKLCDAYNNNDYKFVEKLTVDEKEIIVNFFKNTKNLEVRHLGRIELLEEFYNKAIFLVGLSKNNLVFINR